VDTWLGSSTGWLFPARDVWVYAPTTQWDVTPALGEGTWVLACDGRGQGWQFWQLVRQQPRFYCFGRHSSYVACGHNTGSDRCSDSAPSGITSGPLKTDNITNDTTPTFRWNVATDASGIQGYWWAVDDSTPESGGTWIGKPLLGWGSTVDATPTVTVNGSHTIYVKAVMIHRLITLVFRL